MHESVFLHYRLNIFCPQLPVTIYDIHTVPCHFLTETMFALLTCQQCLSVCWWHAALTCICLCSCLCDDLRFVLIQTTRLWADAQGTGTSGQPFKNDGATVVADQPQPQLKQELAASLRLASSHAHGSSRQDHIHLFKNHAREGKVPCLHEHLFMLSLLQPLVARPCFMCNTACVCERERTHHFSAQKA